MKRFFLLIPILVFCISCQHHAPSVSSPDGQIRVSFRLTPEGMPEYRSEWRTANGDGSTVIDWSSLGLVAEEVMLDRGFRYAGVEKSVCDTVWETVWGEERFIRDHHQQMTVHLSHRSGMRMDIIFRVFDDGFAFRYHLLGVDEKWLKRLTITDECTEYRFVREPEVWSIPWRTEYYEGLWQKAPLSAKCDTMCSPVTIEWADGRYAFVHEAALTDYPAQNLYVERTKEKGERMKENCLKTYLTPWRMEPSDVCKQSSEVKAYVDMPFVTPWRMVVLARDIQTLASSRIMLNLNEPCRIEDTSWIRPMKFMGIWWGMHIKSMTWEQGPKHGATTKNMERYMRFAKQHGIEAVLAEGWNQGWETWQHFSFTEPYSDWDMDYLSGLSRTLGVAIVGHNETGGNAADYESVLDEAYQYHQAHGISVIKTGYVAPIIRTVDGHQWNKGQSGVRHYRKVIETAARYHIAIDNHEPVMPTGLQRTYPNLMTQEGVRGQEWNAWSRDGGSPCEHVTVLPFTRILAGPVDYTPGVFRFENPVLPTTRVHSTLMNQLGLFVCFYSPLQMVCDLPEHYMTHADAFRFIEEVPCDWERSLLIDGAIGDLCVYARQGRGSEDWFVGGITDEQSREAVVPLGFLREGERYRLTLYRDGDDAHWDTNPYAYVIETTEVSSADTLRVRMAEGGGFGAILRKQ